MKISIDTDDHESLLDTHLTGIGDMLIAQCIEYRDSGIQPTCDPDELVQGAKDVRASITKFLEIAND